MVTYVAMDLVGEGKARLYETTDDRTGTGGVDNITLGDGNNTVLGGMRGDTIASANGTDTILGDNGFIQRDIEGNNFALIATKSQNTTPGPQFVTALGGDAIITGMALGWDQAIATTEQLLANSQRKVDALLQQLLTNPAARGEWPMAPIGKIAERVQRRAKEDEELPVLMISSGNGFVRQDEKYSRFMAGKSVENYIALDYGEFAYNKGNSKLYEFGCVFPLLSHKRGLVPHVYVCFKLSASLHAGFYEHLFRADYLHDQLGALVNTGVRNNGLLNIRPADFLACEVPVPPLGEQQRIAEIISAATTWSEQQARDLGLLKQEKAALMSQLLTGKRRVKLSEAEMEAQA